VKQKFTLLPFLAVITRITVCAQAVYKQDSKAWTKNFCFIMYGLFTELPAGNSVRTEPAILFKK
jgi:hypothetical protein